MIKKGFYSSICMLFLVVTISCEKDFQDIGSSVINNTKFSTNDIFLEVEMKRPSDKGIASVRADNIELGFLGAYLFGTYKKTKGNDKAIVADIVSQLSLPSSLKIVEKTLEEGQTVKSTLDEFILKIPLQATSIGEESDGKPIFMIDSLLGNSDANFTVEVFEGTTFLNELDPIDTSKGNSFQSNSAYDGEIDGEQLNPITNFNFKGAAKDTLYIFERTLSTGVKFKDTLKVANGTITANPFKVIQLDKTKLELLFFDKFTDGELIYKDGLSSQDQLNILIKNLIIKVSGNEGAMVSLNFSIENLKPSLDILYTNTIFNNAGVQVDSVKRNHSFKLGEISNSRYKMTNAISTVTNTSIIQGTAGSLDSIRILGVNISKLTPNDAIYNKYEDVNGDGFWDLEELYKDKEGKSFLVNEASLTFYINKNTSVVDTTDVPKRLFLYKHDDVTKNSSKIKDLLLEGQAVFGGQLETSGNKPDNYRFRITHYISDLLSGKRSYDTSLRLKVHNTTDVPLNLNDTLVQTYNWDPRSVPLLNHQPINGERRAQLKISYTKKN